MADMTLHHFQLLHSSLFIANPTNPRTSHQTRSLVQTACLKLSPPVSELSTPARQPLDEIPIRDTFAWNTLIRAHIADGDPFEAILVYRHMILRGVRPDKHTLPRVITAAARISDALPIGMQIHAQAIKLGFLSDGYVITALIELYGHLGGPAAAAAVFDCSRAVRNSVSWTVLAKLYLLEDKPDMALNVFYRMIESNSECDAIAVVTASRACGKLKSFREGKKVHEIARKGGLEFEVLVANALLKMYIDCEKIDEARDLFDQMPVRDALSWTTLIGVYVQSGGFNEGLKLFRQMCSVGLRPDSFAVSAILPACARMAAHKNGKEIHAHILRSAIHMNVTVQNALMDMYAKSSSIEGALKIFERMTDKDEISWTVMILGYTLHGQGELAVELFHEMENDSGVPIDSMSVGAALHACSMACKIEEGKRVFELINDPQLEDFALMVGLLSRAGHFDEAREFIQKHQIGNSVSVVRALLDSCRIHQNVTMGKCLIEQLIELEPLNAENYILLSSAYASSGKLEKVREVRGSIQDMGLKPRKAYSWIEVRNKVHTFGVGDVSHPRSERLYWELQNFLEKMKGKGITLENDFSLHDVDEESECIPQGHSELLAIVFGLISTGTCTTVRVSKNLRVCRNCHAVAKFISETVEREILLKDPNCFHHFKNGSCSCGNIW